MSILEMRELFEAHKRNIILGLLFSLTSSISFALGYMSPGEASHPQIVVNQNGAASSTPAVVQKAKTATKKVVPKIPAVKEVVPPPVTIVYTPPPIATTTPPIVEQPPPNTHASPVASAFTEVSADKPPGAVPSPTPAPIAAPAQAPAALVSIQITEVTAGSEMGSDDEFIELYNPNSVAVDVSSYSIKKRTASGSESALVSASRLTGKSIPPGKHFLIAHDAGYRGSVAPDATWAKSNDLAYANNAVVLYNGSGVKITEVSWTKLDPGQSTAGAPTPQNSLF